MCISPRTTPVFSELLLQFTLADEKQKEENWWWLFWWKKNWPFCFFSPRILWRADQLQKEPMLFADYAGPKQRVVEGGNTDPLSGQEFQVCMVFFICLFFLQKHKIFPFPIILLSTQTWQIRNFNTETSELWCLNLQNIAGSILRLYDSNVCIKKKASSKNEESRAETVSGYPRCLLISSAAFGAWIAPPQLQET